MQFTQLTTVIALLTQIRDYISSSRTDQRVYTERIIEKLEEQDQHILRVKRPPTPRPPHPLDDPILPEERVRMSRGRYPAFRPSKSSVDLPRSPPYK